MGRFYMNGEVSVGEENCLRQSHVKLKTRAQWEEEGRKEKVMFEDYKRSQEAQINYTPLPLLPWEGQ